MLRYGPLLCAAGLCTTSLVSSLPFNADLTAGLICAPPTVAVSCSVLQVSALPSPPFVQPPATAQCSVLQVPAPLVWSLAYSLATTGLSNTNQVSATPSVTEGLSTTGLVFALLSCHYRSQHHWSGLCPTPLPLQVSASLI